MRKFLVICFLLIPSYAFADMITLTDIGANVTFQRTIGGTTGSVPISGTYTGTAPTHVQCQAVQHGTSTPIISWANIITESISSGTWSGKCANVPQGNPSAYLYDMQVRESNATSIYSNGSNPWRMGILAINAGQSNDFYGWSVNSLAGGDTVTANPMCSAISAVTTGSSGNIYDYTGVSAWGAPMYNASATFCNALVSNLGVPIGLVMYGFGGSSMTSNCQQKNMITQEYLGYWLNTDSSCWSTLAPVISASAPIVEITTWMQGEEEAIFNCDISNYSTYLLSMISQIRTTTTSPVIAVAGLNGCTYSAYYPDIRTQQQTAVTSDSGNGHSTIYVDMSDLNVNSSFNYIHYTTANNITVGQRLANAVLSYYPAPTTYTISGTVSGSVQSGVTITLSGTSSASTATDGSGNYSFTGLISGSYLITATLNGYTFLPVPLAVAITNTNLTGENFVSTTATAVPGAFSVIGNWIGNGQ